MTVSISNRRLDECFDLLSRIETISGLAEVRPQPTATKWTQSSYAAVLVVDDSSVAWANGPLVCC